MQFGLERERERVSSVNLFTPTLRIANRIAFASVFEVTCAWCGKFGLFVLVIWVVHA